MRPRAIVFDLYGTLVNIRTDEHDPSIYEEISAFLGYSHVNISPDELHDAYFSKIRDQIERSRETHPDVNVLKVFHDILHEYGEGRMELRLPLYTARLFRSLSRKVFEPFPGVYGMLERLRERFPLALLSDAQRCYTEPEIKMLKLDWFFDVMYLSSDHGFRKPEPRYFRLALESLGGIRPSQAVYVGDNHYRDLTGAKGVGMKMVLVRSDEREYEDVQPDAYIEEIAMLEDALEGI